MISYGSGIISETQQPQFPQATREFGGACVCSSNQARFVRLELEAVCSEVLCPPLHSHCWGSVKNSTATNIECIVQVPSDSGTIISIRWTPVALHITSERCKKLNGGEWMCCFVCVMMSLRSPSPVRLHRISLCDCVQERKTGVGRERAVD